MITRYSRPDAVAIWSQETKYKIWFEIEAHAATKMAELGVIPQDAADAIWAKGKDATFDADRIDEIERTTKHDVIAFLTWMAEGIGEPARFMHQGMTSSDVLDTCLAVQLARAADLLLADLDALLAALKGRAMEHRRTPTVGRSHGIHAEPTTFGLKLAGHYAEFRRNRDRLRELGCAVLEARDGPEALRVLVDDLLGRLALGDVAGDLGVADQLVAIEDRIDHHTGAEARPVLARPPGLGFEAAILARGLEVAQRQALLDVAGGIEAREVRADHVGGVVALDPAAAAVPGADIAARIEHVDGVVGDGVQQQRELP